MDRISTVLLRIYNNKKLLLVSIFVASLLFSLIFLVYFKNIDLEEHNIPTGDYLNCYSPFADSILQGKIVYLNKNQQICAPPGYPIILTGIFSLSWLLGVDKILLITIFNILMVAGAACFLFLIAKLIFKKKIALFASFLWMSYPFNAWLTKNFQTEIPFIFFLYMGVWFYLLALKKRRFGFIFLSGTILGFAVLIRPIGFFLPVLFALMIFFFLREIPKKTQLAFALLLLTGSLLIISPWEVQMFTETGNLIFLSSAGNTPITVGLTFVLRNTAGHGWPAVPSDVLSLMERIKTEDIDGVFPVFSFLSKELIKDPIPVLKLFSLKIIRAWYATSQMWFEKIILAVQLFYLISALAGVIYAVKKYKEKLKNIIFLLSIVFYFWGMTFLALSILRYMIPVMGIVIIFSAISIDLVYKKIYAKTAA